MAKDKETRELPITELEITKAYDRLKKYKSGKSAIDNKATANHEWWKGRHWEQFKSTKTDEKRPTSAWLFNSIINKQADMMDNFPKPNVLPRKEDDKLDAEMLGDVIPCILEQNHYEELYKAKCLDYIADGTAITSVLWDSSKDDGLGNVAINQVDIHNIFFKPGIEDIQDSPEVFVVSGMEDDEILAIYPEMEGHLGNDLDVVKYLHDDNIDTHNLNYVIDWYYKQTIREDVPVGDGSQSIPRLKTILHYCKFCNDVVLYSSENENEEKGFYWHGKYPFVFMKNFAIKDSPCGFGYIDVMKDPQMYVDALDQIVLDNAAKVGKPRFWIREDAGFDTETFLDWSKPFVPYAGSGDLSNVLVPINMPQIPTSITNHMVNKIEELKETSGNRDFNQGGVSNGITAASAVAALQEAGSKLSRLLNKGAYTAFAQECYLIIELIRQFYTEPRSFRVDDGAGGYTFAEYSNANITDDNGMPVGIESVDSLAERRRPIFDIKVVAEKSSPFSRAAQNETAKEMYQLGMFNPQMAEPSLVAMDMMEFEGKDDIKQKIMNNSMMLQQFQMMAQTIMSLEPMLPGISASVGLTPEMGMGASPVGGGNGDVSLDGSLEDRIADKGSESSVTAKARMRTASMATPT